MCFLFKQKTAYEMLISDWSSDVCASDLHLVANLDGGEAADVEADRGIELQRMAAGGGLRVAEHHTDLHADLVDEDHHGVRLGDRGGQLAERLAHQAGLQAGQAVAHLAFQFRLRHQGRSEEHTSELQSLMRISYAVFCLKKKKKNNRNKHNPCRTIYILQV